MPISYPIMPKSHHCLVLAMVGTLCCLPAFAATLTWDADGVAGGGTGGTGTWNTTSTLWNDAGTMRAWDNSLGDLAVFGGTAGTVTLGEAISVVGMTFNTTGYTIAGAGHMLTFRGTMNVVNAGTSALIDSAITLTNTANFSGAGNLTLASTSTLEGAGFAINKSGAGALTLAGSITNAGPLAVSGGELTLSGSMTRDAYLSGAGFSVSGGILNITGTLGTSVTIPTGQSGFSGNSVTNFSGTGFFSGGSSTFRIGEGSSATFNVTGGTMTLGTLSAGLVLGRSNIAAQGFLNISGGSVVVTGNSTVVRIGAGFSDAEVGGAGASAMTLSGTGLFETGTTTGTILLGSNLAGNTSGTGTIHLNGGTLATNRTIIGGSVAESYFNFNGGTLKANGTTMTLATTLTTVNIRNGGGIIDSNGFNISIAKALSHSTIGGDDAIDGGLTKIGAGVLTFSGADANTYTGLTRVLEGTLALAKTVGVNAIAADIVIGDGSTAAVLQLTNSNQIADSSLISFNGSGATAGVFRLNGRTETIGGLVSIGGAGIVENNSATAGVLTLNNTGSQTFSGILRNGSLAGTLSLAKTGPGTQILSGANLYTGATTIDQGTLQFGIDDAISSNSALVIAAGSGGLATLDLNGHAWTAGAITFYNATSTPTSQGVLNIGAGGLLTLGSSSFTLDATANPLGAQITGGTMDLGSASRTLTIGKSDNTLVDLTISSAITSNAGTFGLTKAGPGTLRLTGVVTLGNTLAVSNGVLEIAGAVSNDTSSTTVGSVATPGVLRILAGADLTTTTIFTGTNTNATGAMVMTGGNVLVTTTGMAGVELGRNGYGGLFLSGGTLSTRRVDSGDGVTASSVAMLRVTGGTLTTNSFIMFRNERWEFTVTGGEVQRTADTIALGFRSSSSTTAVGAMTVAGGLVNNAGLLVTMGQQSNSTARGTTHLNLNAGTLATNQIVHHNGDGSSTKGFVNFNGGTLRNTVNTIDLIFTNGTAGTGTLTGYVNGPFGTFGGGAVIDTNGFNSTLNLPLQAPTGDGLSSVAVASAGSGFIGAPFVEITGGGGSGATAYANVDLDPASASYGQLLGIVVSNPGTGYTSAPTINLIGGGGSGATLGAIATAANSSGGLTKMGLGTLTLGGTEANTFTGLTTVMAGELVLSKTAGVTAVAGDIEVGDGTAPAVLRLANSNQIADTSVVTLQGTGANAGIFRLNNRSETVGGLASVGGAGIVENEAGAAGTSVLTLDVASGTQSFSGLLRNGDGVGTDGTLALVKTGSGKQILTGLNSYTGTTLISDGQLQVGVAGAGQTGTGAVTVADGGVLLGTGLVQGSSFLAESGAAIYVGDGTTSSDYGTLTFAPTSGSGAFDFQAGSNVFLDLDLAGTSDQLSFIGTGTNSLFFNSNLIIGPSSLMPMEERVFQLLDWSGLGSTPTFASHFNYTGLLFGNGDEASGFMLPDISASSFAWDISQFTTNGSIAIVVVPEPTRMLLMLVGLSAFVLRRRRATSAA